MIASEKATTKTAFEQAVVRAREIPEKAKAFIIGSATESISVGQAESIFAKNEGAGAKGQETGSKYLLIPSKWIYRTCENSIDRLLPSKVRQKGMVSEINHRRYSTLYEGKDVCKRSLEAMYEEPRMGMIHSKLERLSLVEIYRRSSSKGT